MDTIEDGTHLDRRQKLETLDRFAELLHRPGDPQVQAVKFDLPHPPSDNPHYLDLLDELPLVMATLARFSPEVRDTIVTRALTSLKGMQHFIARGTPDGKIQIQSVSELCDYCYFVAGVVGEMLTDIFVHGANWLVEIREELNANARWFGEGLQLVNILKDSADDQRDGRIFIPDVTTQARIFDLARADLRRAEAYVHELKQAEAPEGFVAFADLPLQLAWRTLDYVEQFGPGSKVPRGEVMSILAHTLSGGSMREDASGFGEVARK
jgi:farnesyl-diphosphate farnesyltransferase